ncbi:hypothetical protein KCU88_g1126, partial [Aureobasidium melanogenum]
MILARRRYIISSAIIGFLVLIYLIRGLQDIRPKDYHLLPDQDAQDAQLLYDPTHFSAGVAKPAGENSTRVLVMGRLHSEDVSWVSRELPNLPTKIYTVDSDAVGTDTETITPNATTINTNDLSSRLPANKGHEAMVYLTYIIDHYTSLPDVTSTPPPPSNFSLTPTSSDKATSTHAATSTPAVQTGYTSTNRGLYGI